MSSVEFGKVLNLVRPTTDRLITALECGVETRPFAGLSVCCFDRMPKSQNVSSTPARPSPASSLERDLLMVES